MVFQTEGGFLVTWVGVIWGVWCIIEVMVMMRAMVRITVRKDRR